MLTISLKGDTLTVHIPGQPEYELIPVSREEFVLKNLKITRLKLKKIEPGKGAALGLFQPGRISEAKRIEQKKALLLS